MIALLLGGARACTMISLAEELNILAKEFVAAQDPEDPGVLTLFHFGDAAEHRSRRYWSTRMTWRTSRRPITRPGAPRATAPRHGTDDRSAVAGVK